MSARDEMKTIDKMLEVNRKQAAFYDAIHEAESGKGQGGYSDNRRANLFTRAWAGLRYRQQAAVRQAGIDVQIQAAHDRWIQGKAGGDFLEIGCFSGSPSTFNLAHASGAYLGIELSPKAVATLNARFAASGLAGKARAEACDFLLMDKTKKYDLVYAHGVLHHFENPEPLFAKLALLLKPEGRLLFVEPCAVNPIYQLIRALYRPFQSDAKWEWPFRIRTVAALEQHFQVSEGFGWGCWSLPLSVLTGVPWVGPAITGLYIRLVRREISHGWHAGVWNNSMVTACYQLRPSRGPA